LISSGGTDPGFVCRGGTQLHFSLFLSLSVTPLLHQGHFQPQSFPLILFTTPSFSLPHTLCHSYTLSCFFFPSDTQFFFPFISEYIVASGCECALSTCCNLDRCSLPLSLYLSLSLPTCPPLFLHPGCCRSVFLSPSELRIFPPV